MKTRTVTRVTDSQFMYIKIRIFCYKTGIYNKGEKYLMGGSFEDKKMVAKSC